MFETRAISGSLLSSYRQGNFGDITDGLSQTIVDLERVVKPKGISMES